MMTPEGSENTHGILKVGSKDHVNLAFDPGSEIFHNGGSPSASNVGRQENRHDTSNFNGTRDFTITIQKTPRSKPSRQGFKAGGLLYGENGYFQHPYGNSENFLSEILSKNNVSDKADIENRGPPGKLLVWVAFCLFTLGIAGAIIFGAETSTKKVYPQLNPVPSIQVFNHSVDNISNFGLQ